MKQSNLFKILMILVVGVTMLSSAYAACPSNMLAYWDYETETSGYLQDVVNNYDIRREAWIEDWDMEKTGVTDWSVISGSSLTKNWKSTSDAYSGRSYRLEGGTYDGVRQIVDVESGKQYLMEARVKIFYGNMYLRAGKGSDDSHLGSTVQTGPMDWTRITKTIITPESTMGVSLRCHDQACDFYVDEVKLTCLDCGPTSVTGKVGNGVTFDGSNDGLIYDGSLLSTSTSGQTVFNQYYGTDTERFELLMGSSLSYNKYQYSLGIGGGNINVGQWHHVGFTKNSSGYVNLYQDGQIVDSGIDNYDFGNIRTHLGIRDHTSPAPFNGQMDETVLYNAALTPEQVLALYQGSNNGNDYCEVPIISDYSVNLTPYTNLESASNFELQKDTTKLTWSSVNLSGADLSNVEMGTGFVSVNANAEPNLNTTATVELTVDGCTSYNVYYADSYATSFDPLDTGTWQPTSCSGGSDGCDVVSCTDNTLTLTVNHFDGWGATGDGDTPGVPEFNILGVIIIVAMTGISMYLISRRT